MIEEVKVERDGHEEELIENERDGHEKELREKLKKT